MSKNVILVEDDAALREAVRDLLEDEGYAVHTADNGEHGLDVIAKVGDSPVVLLDLMMPVMDGWQVLDELSRRGSTLPVIVLSASTDGDNAIRRGAVAYLRKPLTADSLLGVVQQHERKV